MVDLNQRTLAQVRPVWDASIVTAGNTEQLTNIPAQVGVTLTVPAGATGFTVSARSPGEANALYVHMAGGLTGAITTADGLGTTLHDANAAFDAAFAASAGDRVLNLTDGSEGVITVVTSGIELSMVGGLSGGTDDDFDLGDLYRIENSLGPRIVMDGGPDADRSRYFPIPADRTAVIYLLAQGLGSVDADVFYHFD